MALAMGHYTSQTDEPPKFDIVLHVHDEYDRRECSWIKLGETKWNKEACKRVENNYTSRSYGCTFMGDVELEEDRGQVLLLNDNALKIRAEAYEIVYAIPWENP